MTICTSVSPLMFFVHCSPWAQGFKLNRYNRRWYMCIYGWQLNIINYMSIVSVHLFIFFPSGVAGDWSLTLRDWCWQTTSHTHIHLLGTILDSPVHWAVGGSRRIRTADSSQKVLESASLGTKPMTCEARALTTLSLWVWVWVYECVCGYECLFRIYCKW